MRLWFARDGEVTLREQLVTQVTLAILSDDLSAGQRLPSTRELARRFRLHPNTVSAGYRQLEREGWLELRRGSGVYVRSSKPEVSPSSPLALDQLVSALFRSARELGAPLSMVRARLRHWMELQPPDHFLLIDPDEELRAILASEIHSALSFPVRSCGHDDRLIDVDGAIPVSLPNRAAAVRKLLPAGVELLTLQVRSVPSSLQTWLPAPVNVMVGIASRWPHFLKTARIVLQAAGFHPDCLLFRDARKPRWERGLQQTAAVVCDSITATRLPKSCRAIPFPLVSESSLDQLRRYLAFVQQPLA